MQISNVEVKPESKKMIDKPSSELGLGYRYKSKEKIYGSAKMISIEKGSKMVNF
jgi:hypothetical protein